MFSLQVNTLDLIVGSVVLAVVCVVWVVNHRRQDQQRQIHVQTEMLVIVVSIVAVAVLMVARSGIVAANPLLFAVGVLCLLAATAGLLDTYLTWKIRADLKLISQSLGAQMAGLGNLQFFPTKEETFKQLTSMTLRAHEKLMATRFSAGDISTETQYWDAIRQRALDPKILSIRIHCLGHTTSTAIDGICKVISEFKGAQQFRLGVTFSNNDFEVIVADDQECIFCFHDLQMTIKNGFSVDSRTVSSAHVVENMGATYRNMLARCYIVVDFGKFVRTDEDVRKLQQHLIQVHREYCQGRLPKPVHASDMEEFLRTQVFQRES